MKKLVTLCAACLVLLVGSLAHAQHTRLMIDPVQVGKFIEDVQSTMKLPAVGAGIVGAQENYFFETYGDVGVETPFLIGSLSQSVTAMAVMLLVVEEKVALEDPVGKWIAGGPQDVTVEMLLRHRSGLVEVDGIRAWTDPEATIEELIEGVRFDASVEEAAPSSLNYQILGAIVAKAAEKPFGEFVKERIFEPVGMKTAHAGLTPPTPMAESHRYWFGFSRPARTPAYHGLAVASDFMWMSSRDMEQWLRFFVLKGKVDKKQVVPENVIETLISSSDNGASAMGWTLDDDDGVGIARHSGFGPVSSATMILVPERNLGVFVMTNVNSFRANATDNIAAGLQGAILERGGGRLTNVEFVGRLGIGIFFFLAILSLLFEIYRWMRAHRPMKIDGRGISRVLGVTGIAIVVPFGAVLYFGIHPAQAFAVAPDVVIGVVGTALVHPIRWVFHGFNQTVMRRVDALVQKFN